jgi:hypothetical protein
MAVDELLDTRVEAVAGGRDDDPDGGAGRWPAGRRGFRLSRRGVIVAAIVLVGLVVLVAVLGSVVGSRSGSGNDGSSGSAMSVPAAAPAGGFGVNRADSSAGGTEIAPDSAAAPAAGAGSALTRSGVAPVPTGADSGAARPAGVQPRIVWTGSMNVQVEAGAVDRTIQKVSAAAQGLGGYLSANQVTGTATTADDVPQSATITVRVPAASFGKLQDSVTGLGTVNSSTTSSQDVTAQYVDLQAREDALTTSRGTYLTLLSKATTVGDILAVQQQIDGVQTQIEQIEGQRKVLADQSDLGTLTVDLSEKGAQVHEPGKQNGFVHAFRVAGRSFLRGLEGIISALGVVALIALVVAVLYLLYRVPGWFRRRTSGRAGATGGRTAPEAPVGATPAETTDRPAAANDEPTTGTTGGEG